MNKIIFRFLNFDEMKSVIAENKKYLTDDKIRGVFINKAIKEGENKYILMAFTNYLKDSDIKELLDTMSDIEFFQFIEDIDEFDHDYKLVIKKICSYNCKLEIPFLYNAKLNSEDISLLADLTKDGYALIECMNMCSKLNFKILNRINKEKINLTEGNVDSLEKNIKYFDEKELDELTQIFIRFGRFKALVYILENNLIKNNKLIIDTLVENANKEILNGVDINKLELRDGSKIIKGIIELNSTSELVIYSKKITNRFYDSFIINELLKENALDDLVEYLKINIELNENNANTIYNFAIIKNDPSFIYKVAYLLNDKLSHIQIDALGLKLNELNNITNIYLYLKNIKNYSEEIKLKLMNKILKSKKMDFICLIIIYIDFNLLTNIFKDINEMYVYIIENDLFDSETLMDVNKKLFPSKDEGKILKKRVKNNLEKLVNNLDQSFLV